MQLTVTDPPSTGNVKGPVVGSVVVVVVGLVVVVVEGLVVVVVVPIVVVLVASVVGELAGTVEVVASVEVVSVASVDVVAAAVVGGSELEAAVDGTVVPGAPVVVLANEAKRCSGARESVADAPTNPTAVIEAAVARAVTISQAAAYPKRRAFIVSSCRVRRSASVMAG